MFHKLCLNVGIVNSTFCNIRKIPLQEAWGLYHLLKQEKNFYFRLRHWNFILDVIVLHNSEIDVVKNNYSLDVLWSNS